MSRYTNDIDTLTEILQNGMISLISGGLTFIGVVAMMLYLSPLLFLVTVFSLGLMLAVIMTVGKRARRYFMAPTKDPRSSPKAMDSSAPTQQVRA